MAKTKKVKQPTYVAPTTYEGWLALEHSQWEIHHQVDQVPDPNYIFKVGEECRYGALSDCRVEEVLDGGKRLHISYHDKGKAAR